MLKIIVFTGLILCAPASGQQILGGGGGGAGGTAVKVSHTFASSGTFSYVHNLNFAYPATTCNVLSPGLVSDFGGVDLSGANSAVVTATVATTIECTFTSGGGATGATGATGGFAANAEYNTNYTMTNADCVGGGSIKTILSTATTFTLITPITGCSLIVQNNNASSALTLNLTTNSVTGNNGSTSNITAWLPACPSQPSGCAAGSIKANGTSNWDISLGAGLPGPTGATGATGSGGATVQSANLGTNTTASPPGTGARVLGTTYHNTLAVPLTVVVACSAASIGSTTQLAVLTDSNSTPTQYITLQNLIVGSAVGQWLGVTFPVLAGNYYTVIGTSCDTAADGNGTLWTEWH